MMRCSRRRGIEIAGYAMAALLVVLMIASLLLTAALPVWTTVVKREREAELIWRGTQYARAVDLFRRKYGYVYPPDLDILLRERFLRKTYKDPMTEDGEFRLLYAIQEPDQNIPSNLADPLRQPHDPASRGGIIGVVSKNPNSSLRLFNGIAKYDEWAFTPPNVFGRRAEGGRPLKGGPPPPPGAH